MSSMLKQATQTVRVEVTCFSCGNTISLFKNWETAQYQVTLDIYGMLLYITILVLSQLYLIK